MQQVRYIQVWTCFSFPIGDAVHPVEKKKKRFTHLGSYAVYAYVWGPLPFHF